MRFDVLMIKIVHQGEAATNIPMARLRSELRWVACTQAANRTCGLSLRKTVKWLRFLKYPGTLPAAFFWRSLSSQAKVLQGLPRLMEEEEESNLINVKT